MRAKALGRLCGGAALSLVLGAVPAVAQDPSPSPDPASEAAVPAPAPAPADAPGGLLKGPASVERHWSRYRYPESIPDGATYYIIVRGDTLWDISRRFLGSPFLWPQVWDRNRYITDAHWIYPGDPIIIPEVDVVGSGAGGAGVADDFPDADDMATTGMGPGGGGDLLYPAIEETALQCSHYIVDAREDESLHLIGSEDGATKNAFADRDILYLSKGSNAGVKPGDIYSIHHASYDVKHPDSQKTIGVKVDTTGWGRVILVQEDTATLVVEQACMDIHLGDYLRPFERLDVPLIPRHAPPDRLTPPSGKVVGAVVDIEGNSGIAGERQLVSINLGTANGIAPGNLLTVYKVMYPSVPSPRNVIGELAVVTVRERTATARVIYSRDAIMPGDRAELQ